MAKANDDTLWTLKTCADRRGDQELSEAVSFVEDAFRSKVDLPRDAGGTTIRPFDLCMTAHGFIFHAMDMRLVADGGSPLWIVNGRAANTLWVCYPSKRDEEVFVSSMLDCGFPTIRTEMPYSCAPASIIADAGLTECEYLGAPEDDCDACCIDVRKRDCSEVVRLDLIRRTAESVELGCWIWP